MASMGSLNSWPLAGGGSFEEGESLAGGALLAGGGSLAGGWSLAGGGLLAGGGSLAGVLLEIMLPVHKSKDQN